MRWLPGNRLKLYTCQSLEDVGEATVKAVERCTDKAAYEVGMPATMQGERACHDRCMDDLLRPLMMHASLNGTTMTHYLCMGMPCQVSTYLVTESAHSTISWSGEMCLLWFPVGLSVLARYRRMP